MVHRLRGTLAEETIDDPDCIYISLSSDRLGNAFDRWGQNGDRASEMLDNISRMLKSNKQFKMNDSFQLAFVHVHPTPVGKGLRKKYLPGHQLSQRLKEFKRSCITMPQDDAQLCAVRAIVLARGIHHAGSNHNKHQKWTDPKICVCHRDQEARALLGEVGLRPGPYGTVEILYFFVSDRRGGRPTSASRTEMATRCWVSCSSTSITMV